MEDKNALIRKLEDKNKNRIEFIIILFAFIVFLYFIDIKVNILQKYMNLIILSFELLYLFFIMLIIITNKKLNKLITERKQSFKNKIEFKEENISIEGISYNSEKGLSQEEIDRIDIFSKDKREIISNNLIEGNYHNIDFKSYDIKLIDKEIYMGKWISLDTNIKDTMNIYISNKNTYLKDFIYPKTIYEEIKNNKYKIFVKNNIEEITNCLILLKQQLNSDIYVSIINSKINILILTKNTNENIEDNIKEIYNYIDIIQEHKKCILIDK